MPKEKKFSRSLQSRVGGRLLRMFDQKCVEQELNESEGIREALRKFVDYDKADRKNETQKHPFFDKPRD